jgi:hypothetical protein
MAVYTKLRRLRIARIWADGACYESRELTQVWTVLEGETVPVRRYIYDLVADRGLAEILSIVRAEAEAKTANHRTPIFPL